MENIKSKKPSAEPTTEEIRKSKITKIEVETSKGKLFVTATADGTEKLLEKIILERPQKAPETQQQRGDQAAINKLSDAIKDKAPAKPIEEKKKVMD